MLVRKFRSEGTAHLSYFIGQGSEAAIIDPRRDVDAYMDLAFESEMAIKYVLETHRNEDYVIGSQELAARTGAKIFHGGQLPFRYGNEVKDRQELAIGNLKIVAVHTPGHTFESYSYVLYDPSTSLNPIMVFTGDTLLVGEVGRVDFLGRERRQELAGLLYDSIFNRLVPLGQSTIVCPGHGAGSVCGMEISEREDTTIGIEATNNKYLKMNRQDFISVKVAQEMEQSPLFKRMEVVNLEGPRVVGRAPAAVPLSPKDVKHTLVKGATVIDLRSASAFATAHVPGSINLHTDFLPIYAPMVIPWDRPAVLIPESIDSLDRAIDNLFRIGYDDVSRYLKGGMDHWLKGGNEVSTLGTLTVRELRDRKQKGEDMLLIDVRDLRERSQGTIEDASAIHLGEIMLRMNGLPKNRTIVLFCGSGYRGSCAASILSRNSFTKTYNLLGGFQAWKNANYPVAK